MVFPPLARKIDLGLYFCESDRYGSQTAKVAPWSNTTVHWCYRDHHSSEASANEWLKTLRASLQRTYAAGRKIHFDLNLQADGTSAATPLDAAIGMLGDFWSKVATGSLADEPLWNAPKTAAQAARVRKAIRAAGLSTRPLGVVYSVQQVAKFPAVLSSLDFAGVELYTATSAGYLDSARNLKELRAYIKKAFALVPKTKQIVVIPQTYSRNYDFNAIRDLKKGTAAYNQAVQNMIDLLGPMYEALGDPRVISALCFSWARASGAMEYRRLAGAVKAFGVAACR